MDDLLHRLRHDMVSPKQFKRKKKMADFLAIIASHFLVIVTKRKSHFCCETKGIFTIFSFDIVQHYQTRRMAVSVPKGKHFEIKELLQQRRRVSVRHYLNRVPLLFPALPNDLTMRIRVNVDALPAHCFDSNHVTTCRIATE